MAESAASVCVEAGRGLANVHDEVHLVAPVAACPFQNGFHPIGESEQDAAERVLRQPCRRGQACQAQVGLSSRTNDTVGCRHKQYFSLRVLSCFTWASTPGRESPSRSRSAPGRRRPDSGEREDDNAGGASRAPGITALTCVTKRGEASFIDGRRGWALTTCHVSPHSALRSDLRRNPRGNYSLHAAAVRALPINIDKIVPMMLSLVSWPRSFKAAKRPGVVLSRCFPPSAGTTKPFVAVMLVSFPVAAENKRRPHEHQGRRVPVVAARSARARTRRARPRQRAPTTTTSPR